LTAVAEQNSIVSTEFATNLISRLISDTNSTGSSENFSYVGSGQVSDTVASGSSEAVSSIAFGSSISDAIAASDAVSASTIFAVSMSESAAVSDSIQVTTLVYVADNLGATDSYLVTVTHSGNVADSLSVTSAEAQETAVYGNPTHETRIDATMLSQNTASTMHFFLRSSADHLTAVDGLNPLISISKAGGAFTPVSRTVTNLGNGIYSVALTSADTNFVGELMLLATNPLSDNSLVIASIIPPSTLSSWDIATAVWNSPIATMTDPNTIGGWIRKKVLTIPKFLGLK
jgi:hypothetical protein